LGGLEQNKCTEKAEKQNNKCYQTNLVMLLR